jgi:hypothetical protein
VIAADAFSLANWFELAAEVAEGFVVSTLVVDVTDDLSGEWLKKGLKV